MALSWYKITPPRRFGSGSHFVKASDKKDALSKGVRVYRRLTKEYNMIPPGPIRMGEFKAVKISDEEAREELILDSQRASARVWTRKVMQNMGPNEKKMIEEAGKRHKADKEKWASDRKAARNSKYPPG